MAADTSIPSHASPIRYILVGSSCCSEKALGYMETSRHEIKRCCLELVIRAVSTVDKPRGFLCPLSTTGLECIASNEGLDN